jgi:hypothetical protein
MLKGLLQMLGLFVHRPPRRARTKCRVAPPSSWYSFAVLSSFLYIRAVSRVFFISCTHLLDRPCTYICLPPKIKRCCAGGIPSFSSTRSLMRETCGWRFVSQIVLVFLGRVYCHGSLRESSVSRAVSYFVVRLNIELNLLAGQGAHSTRK